jgi:Flp pilus assembly protein TadD
MAHGSARGVLLLIALVLAVGLAYSPVWDAGFIWDDDAHVTTNPVIIGPLGLKEIWTSAKANYFPLTMTSFWTQHALWGLNPLPYHLVGVALQAACAVMLYLVLRRLRVRGALLGAALWGLHPVQVESVAWISELKNTQSAFFFLIAVWFFLRWLDREPVRANWRDYGVALLCAVLAMLSKTSTVMLPVVLGLVWWWRKEWRWRNVIWLGPFLLVSLAASGWTIWEQKVNSMASGPDWHQSLPERFVLAGKVVWFYLGKLAWPDPLIFIYPRWKLDATAPAAWIPLGALVVATAVLVWWRNGWARPWFFAGAFFAISLFPVMGFFDVFYFRYSFVADHFQHLASMGPLALAGAGIVEVLGGRLAPLGAARWAAAMTLVAALGAQSRQQCALYRNSHELWRATAELNPHAWIARVNLGVELVAAGRAEEAVRHYRAALEQRPGAAEIQANLGAAYLHLDRAGEAVPVLEAAVRTLPRLAEAHNSLGLAYAKLGAVGAAERSYREAIRLQPGFPAALFNLASLLAAQQRAAEAIALLEAAQRGPGDATVRNQVQRKLVEVLVVTGQHQAVVAPAEAVLRTAPADAHIRQALAGAYFQLGRFAEAAAHYAELLRQQPAAGATHQNLASAYLQLGRHDEAVRHYLEALRLSPSAPDIRANLAIALARQGRLEEARAQCEQVLQAVPAHPTARGLLEELRSGRPRS